MVNPNSFVSHLVSLGIDFFAGVPDSLLKSLCAYIQDNIPADKNIIAANEGGAMALAAGHYLASGKPGVVYMQNSGIGNAVNPLLSLTDSDVYAIPALLIIGWRGEPGVKDEPQHVKQGKVTIPLLETMGIAYQVLDCDTDAAMLQLDQAAAYMRQHSKPYALIVRKDTFEPYRLVNEAKAPAGVSLNREAAIATALDCLPDDAVIVSTTGMISRELFETREKRRQNHGSDFLTVGSMGHASQIALGIALEKTKRTVCCFDGDGAAIMHMGALGIVGQLSPANYIHIVFNNGAHDSVGGQPTIGFRLDLPEIAKASGYAHVYSTDDCDTFAGLVAQASETAGPTFIEIKVCKGARKDLGRPTTTPQANKHALMQNLADD
ncbi:MAG: phosphonopyruvate decarboxylase [Muribaculaceae bacterium]|nr:phosphonopyruvate decarboxylase [Muribaculaceae bacterium]